MKRLLLAVLLLSVPAVAGAQTTTPPIPIPKALVFPNYDNVLVGKDQTLEGGSYIARTGDASANFYNPAGLVSADKTSLNASSTGWVMSRISSEALQESITSSKIDNVPGYIGVVFGSELGTRDVRLGISLTRTVAWSPGDIDLEALPTMSGPINRVTYSSASSFQTLLYQAAAAWAPVRDRSLRLGVSFGFADTGYSADTTLSGFVTLQGQQSHFLATLRDNGDEYNLVAGLGVQWDVVAGLTVGALFRSPGARTGSSSQVTYESAFVRPTGSSSSYFRDEGGTFRYKQPLELGIGVAYDFGKAQLEADVRYHSAVSTYNFYESNQPYQILTENPDGTTSQSTLPGPQVTYAARQVFNAALGGNLKLGRVATLHSGFYSALSPVQDQAASPFRQANLYGFTGGVDFQLEHFGFSLGAGYQWGNARPTTIPIGGMPVPETGLKVESISLLYAISASF